MMAMVSAYYVAQEQIDKVMEIHEGREHLLQKGGLFDPTPTVIWNLNHIFVCP